MNYLIHATPVHPSLCLQYFILLFTIATVTVFTLLLLLLFYYYHHYKTVATDKPLRASLFLGTAELITHLLRLINILWLPLCQINKFGFYFPQRLLRSPILVGHHPLVKVWSLGLVSKHWNTIYNQFRYMFARSHFYFRLKLPLIIIHITCISLSLCQTSAPIHLTSVLGVLGT
jgi:hypothetical protein